MIPAIISFTDSDLFIGRVYVSIHYQPSIRKNFVTNDFYCKIIKMGTGMSSTYELVSENTMDEFIKWAIEHAPKVNK